jgi:RNA exonuclease 1
MFRSKGLFSQLPCPADKPCELPNCMFKHPDARALKPQREPSDVQIQSQVDTGSDRKRLKLQDGQKVAVSSPKHEVAPPKKPFVGLLAPKSSATTAPSATPSASDGVPKSLKREISPPPPRKVGAKKPTQTSTSPTSPTSNNATLTSSRKQSSRRRTVNNSSSQSSSTAEDLNPRMVNGNPAPHGSRLAYLNLIHGQMARLNSLVQTSTDAATLRLLRTADELVKLALDEEEHVARTQAPVYKTVIGHTIVKFRKFDLTGWISYLESKKKLADPTPAISKEPVFAADLTFELERLLLNRLRINLDGLDKHGFIITLPTEAGIAATKKAVQVSDYWEFCDRCSTRFQVYPDRRADGALTSGGACRYHWARQMRDPKTKEMIRPCCGALSGTPGCTVDETHVFKTSDPTRLADSLQFVETPDNDKADSSLAVSFDCEMGYTTLGMEMIRFSAATWPQGKKLVDVLVRPMGHVLDLNTRFSGVTPDQFLNAEEYRTPDTTAAIEPTPTCDGSKPTPPSTRTRTPDAHTPPPAPPLQILPSPAATRALLFTLISPHTPLIGHSIDNDLNVLRIIHPTIVDTCILFKHPAGLPYRFGLKRLTKEHLRRDIQNAGADGHDSLEDARATGDLVRVKVAKEWSLLRSRGWKVEGGTLVAPDGWVDEAAGSGLLKPVDEWWVEGREDSREGWWWRERGGREC